MGIYLKETLTPDFISSGCTVLDLVLGGGWASNRIINVVGGSSAGKTLLALEAIANFIKKHKKAKIVYNDAESALDESYATSLGIPLDQIEFRYDIRTIEEWHDDVLDIIEKQKTSKVPVFYLLDSLDALSDIDEMSRAIDKGSMGAQKAKKISEMLRKLSAKMNDARVTLFIISQVRDRIGVMFGRKEDRSGGRALTFYASQVLFIKEVGKIEKTIRGTKLPIGIETLIQCTKNKVGMPFRKCMISIIFNYGIDNVLSCLEYLSHYENMKQLCKDLEIKAAGAGFDKTYLAKMRNTKDYEDLSADISEITVSVWNEIEKEILPKRSKYSF